MAVVRLFVDGEEVSRFQAYSSGDPTTPTPLGQFTVTGHLGTVHTSMWRSEVGHEFLLRHFLQFKGNFGFHAYKINDATGQEEPGPTHGCIALSAADAEGLYRWASDGTPVIIETSR